MAKFYYNGVLLPEIPADVLADYPYCWIRKNTSTGNYDLVFGEAAWYNNGTMTCKIDNGLPWYIIPIAGSEEAIIWTHKETTTGGFGIDSARTVLWSNQDVYTSATSTATVYMIGSKPVPEEMEDEKWYQISSYTLNCFADQARRIDSKTTIPMTPPMMLEVFKNVPSYWSLPDGYNVMCFDEHGKILELYRIKKGHSINKPIYDCKFWKYESGSSALFPITPTDNIFLYAFDDSLESELYEHYGIDKVLYPYLQIGIDDTYVTIWFGEAYEICQNETFGTYISYSTPIIGNRYAINYTGRAGLSTTEISNLDLTDINQVVEITMSKITKVNTGTNYMGNDLSGLYTNFAHDVTGSVATLRLDE